METLIVKIKNKHKAAFTKELLSSFSFLEIEDQKPVSAMTQERKRALVKGFKELKQVEEGKLKAKPASDLLKKLRNARP